MRQAFDIIADNQLGTTIVLGRFARSLLRHGIIPEAVGKDIQNDIREGIRKIKAEFGDDNERLRDILWTHRVLIHNLEPRSQSYSTDEVMDGSLGGVDKFEPVTN